MNVIEGGFGKRAPSDLAAVLRGLADRAEAGELTSIVGMLVENGGYAFLTSGASLQEEVFLSKHLDIKVASRCLA